MIITRRRLLAASAFAPMLLAGPVRAQAWPNRFVRLIVPYPAGGGADAIARILGAKLSEMWGQQVLIENKGGAGGNIASDAAAKSPPDGYTMYLGAEFLSTNPHVYPKLSYDAIADLTPVTLGGAVSDHRGGAEEPRRRRPCRSSSPTRNRRPAAPSARRATAPARTSRARCSSAPQASSSRTCPIAAPRPD